MTLKPETITYRVSIWEMSAYISMWMDGCTDYGDLRCYIAFIALYQSHDIVWC